MPDGDFVGQLTRDITDPSKTSPHAEALTAALRDDERAVRTSIAHLDQRATEQLRHACIRLAECCWDHGTDLIRNARRTPQHELRHRQPAQRPARRTFV